MKRACDGNFSKRHVNQACLRTTFQEKNFGNQARLRTNLQEKSFVIYECCIALCLGVLVLFRLRPRARCLGEQRGGSDAA